MDLFSGLQFQAWQNRYASASGSFNYRSNIINRIVVGNRDQINIFRKSFFNNQRRDHFHSRTGRENRMKM